MNMIHQVPGNTHNTYCHGKYALTPIFWNWLEKQNLHNEALVYDKALGFMAAWIKPSNAVDLDKYFDAIALSCDDAFILNESYVSWEKWKFENNICFQ